MNFGGLTLESDEAEYSRVVLHEFGHALGMIHEHQNPANEIQWNNPEVYRALGGPPNNWDTDTIDHNMFREYSQDQTQFTDFDEKSIMLYSFPRECA
jgi:serralysin